MGSFIARKRLIFPFLLPFFPFSQTFPLTTLWLQPIRGESSRRRRKPHYLTFLILFREGGRECADVDSRTLNCSHVSLCDPSLHPAPFLLPTAPLPISFGLGPAALHRASATLTTFASFPLSVLTLPRGRGPRACLIYLSNSDVYGPRLLAFRCQILTLWFP